MQRQRMKASPQFNAKVAKVWGRGAPDAEHSFYLFPPLRDYFSRCLSGRTHGGRRDWYEAWVVETYLADIKPVPACLSICCGFGEVERVLSRLNAFQHCVALDLAPTAIASAKAAARADGIDNIEYRIADLNAAKFEPERYDIVWSNGALHHITNLDQLVEQIHKTLKPGGLLVANEYVGPNHQQLPHRQLEIINAVMHLLPHHLRDTREETLVPRLVSGSRWGRRAWRASRFASRRLARLFGRKTQPFQFRKLYDNNPRRFIQQDPSEGVRASDIIPIIKRTFSDVEVGYYNGSILQYALDHGFYERFDHAKPNDRDLFELLTNIEQTMIRIGELQPDNAHIIARKKP